MEKEELLDEYEAGDLDSATHLKRRRDAIREHTGLHVPRRMGEIREWWPRNKSVVARRLREEDGEDDSDGADNEDTTDDGDEEEVDADTTEAGWETSDVDDPDNSDNEQE